jgi:WD40 repeat protein
MSTPINPIPEDLNPEFIDDDLDDRDMPGLHPPTLNAVTAIRGGFAGVRQSVWERTGLGSLPIFNPSVKRAIETKVENQEEPPISSHLPSTSSIPQVNYKHLYLSRRIISNRIRKDEVRPMIVDAITSIESGGLSGHTEAIYSLSLFRHDLTFNIGTPKPTYSFLQDSERVGILEVGGRDWLLSGSRDKTLRLWSLDTPKPKVVKVFMGGHDGSVLSTFVVKLSSSENGASIEKMVAISGGSDGKICRWDIEGDGKAEKEVVAHTGSVLCVKGDQERVVSCSKGQASPNSVLLADNQTGR